MNPPISIAYLLKSVRQLDSTFSKEYLYIIKTSSFRSLASMEEQIIFLKNHATKIKQSDLSTLFNQSQSKISRIINRQVNKSEIKKLGPSSLLTLKEEENIIEYIIQRRGKGDCSTSWQVRYYAQQLYEKRTKQIRCFDKSWFYNFKNRHIEIIGVKKIASKEEERQKIHVDEVYNYIGNLLNAITTIKSPSQIINIDETGFSVRPNKGKSQKCVFIKTHRREPSWKKARDANHISFLASINLSGESLKPFFITVTEVKFDDLLGPLKDYFAYVKTKKGYLTTYAMKLWINLVLKDYAIKVRKELDDINAKIIIIMDNFKCHINNEIQNEFQNIGNIILICLPPHSSHLFQPLDLFPFKELKRIYNQGNKTKTKPMVNGKIFDILKSWNQAAFKMNLFIAWSRAGIDKFPGKIPVKLNIRTFTRIIRSQCIGIEDLIDIDINDWKS